MNTSKETPCTFCIKSDVCDKKTEFMRAIKQIPNFPIDLGLHNDGFAMKCLKHFDYIRIEVTCKRRIASVVEQEA